MEISGSAVWEWQIEKGMYFVWKREEQQPNSFCRYSLAVRRNSDLLHTKFCPSPPPPPKKKKKQSWSKNESRDVLKSRLFLKIIYLRGLYPLHVQWSSAGAILLWASPRGPFTPHPWQQTQKYLLNGFQVTILFPKCYTIYLSILEMFFQFSVPLNVTTPPPPYCLKILYEIYHSMILLWF